MKQPGQIVVTPFPHTDLSGTKLRPVLLLRQTSDRFDDWLVCMVSSQLHQTDEHMDEVLMPADADFGASGLKTTSVLRLTRLSVLDGALMVGSIGTIANDRLVAIRQRLALWIVG